MFEVVKVLGMFEVVEVLGMFEVLEVNEVNEVLGCGHTVLRCPKSRRLDFWSRCPCCSYPLFPNINGSSSSATSERFF